MFLCFGENWMCFLAPLTGHFTQTFCKHFITGTYFSRAWVGMLIHVVWECVMLAGFNMNSTATLRFRPLAFIVLWEHHWTLPQNLDLHWQSMINDWSLYPRATFTLVNTAKQQRLLLMAFIALALISEWMHTQRVEMNIHMHWKHIFITECVTWHVSLLPPNWISWPQCRNTAALELFRATYGFQEQTSFPKFDTSTTFICLLSEKCMSCIAKFGVF